MRVYHVFYDILVCTMSEIQSHICTWCKSGIMADHVLKTFRVTHTKHDGLLESNSHNILQTHGKRTVDALLPTVLLCYQTDLPSSIDSLLWFVRK